MTRILQVVSMSQRFGGLERVVHGLAAGQKNRGHDAHVVSVVPRGGADTPFHEPLRKSGVQLHVVEIHPRDYLAERRAVSELVQRIRPDVVHTQGSRADVVDGGVARRFGVPTVSTVHGFFHTGGLKARLSDRVHALVLARFQAVVAVSRALGADLAARGVPSQRLVVIPNGWYADSPFLSRAEARRALGIPEGALVAGWVARITAQKALDAAIDALGYLRDLPVSLSVVGDGEDRARMEEHARVVGLADRIRWHGARPGAHEIMRAFDLCVLSSLWEGTPIALFEAMAAGVPIVTSTVGGVPDVVSASEAVLVPPSDPRALADGIRGVLEDRDAAARRSAAALRRIETHYGLEPWLDQYDALYERVIGARRRRL